MTHGPSSTRMTRPADPTPQQPRRVTMRDVAREAGVGTITVSRALQNPERVAAATRQRIDDAVRKLHYVPNLAAGTLRSARSRIVAVIVPTISNSIFSETLQAMSDVLRPAGYHLLIGHSNYSLIEEESLVRTFLARCPDAMVLTGYTHSPQAVELLARAGMPVIEIWNLGRKPIDTIVGLSNYQAAKAMAEYLIAKGHRAIGYIGGLREHNDRSVQREAGFARALKDAGIAVDPSRIVRTSFEFECGAAALNELLARHSDLDAVFAASDILAIGVLLECMRLKLRVPLDLAVAGFDDMGVSSRMTPTLTTVRVPRTQIGRVAAERILARLAGDETGARVIDLGFEVVARESA